jgi:hypothetical protein
MKQKVVSLRQRAENFVFFLTEANGESYYAPAESGAEWSKVEFCEQLVNNY